MQKGLHNCTLVPLFWLWRCPLCLQRILCSLSIRSTNIFSQNTFCFIFDLYCMANKCFPKQQPGALTHSIAFGSAPRREADSQPISPLARPAVSQTETHSLGFLSVADAAPSSGERVHVRASSGRTVMQLAADLLVGDSNPDQATMAPLPPPTVDRPKTLCRLHYHSTGGGVTAICLPTAWSLLSENF